MTRASLLSRGAWRRSIVVLSAFAAVAAVSISPAQASTTRTVHGTVACLNGHSVQGVYVTSSAGGGKFAKTYSFAGTSTVRFFEASISTSSKSTNIRLDIGCGGNSKNWWSNNRTGYKAVTSSKTLNARCAEKAGTGTRCSWPSKGQTTSRNLGARGNCTWGALEQFKKTAGYYPLTSGNAKDWDNNAYGRVVSKYPHLRSMVNFEANTNGAFGAGHVGWVTDLKYRGSGKWDVTVYEMNSGYSGGGFNRYDTHVYRHNPGTMHYILAPIS